LYCSVVIPSVVRILVSAAAIPPNDQQAPQGFWNLTGVTTPLSRRSNLAGYAASVDELDAEALSDAELALPDAPADAELALLAALLVLLPHAASIAAQAQAHAAATHNKIGSFLISLSLLPCETLPDGFRGILPRSLQRRTYVIVTDMRPVNHDEQAGAL
jgi:hypothetical protein